MTSGHSRKGIAHPGEHFPKCIFWNSSPWEVNVCKHKKTKYLVFK